LQKASRLLKETAADPRSDGIPIRTGALGLVLPGRNTYINKKSRKGDGASAGGMMRITKHDKSYLVELSDGSAWRVWPADMADTLQWLPTTEIDVMKIEDETCSHALINRSDGSQVRVIKANRKWSVDEVEQPLSD
jgi:hypothetical protein